jgi:hypothetical protein
MVHREGVDVRQEGVGGSQVRTLTLLVPCGTEFADTFKVSFLRV